MAQPKFLYFDLGNVLLNFSVDLMCRQIGELACVAPAEVHRIVFEGGLETQFELGRLMRGSFHDAFCEQSKTRPACDAFDRASSDIFHLNASIVPVVAQLGRAGHRMGILSNTSEGHWEHCIARFRLLSEPFEVHALSYRIGAMKPDPAIFRAAAELAGVAPDEIFFVDDIPGHVAAARQTGFDAVLYTSTAQFVEDLRIRGLRLNY